MDATRIHLIITHLPVFGLLLGFFALLYGVVRKDRGVKIVSLAIILVSTVGGVIAFQTGEPAEHAVERIAGVSHDAVELHEESAELTNVFVIALGLVALASLYMEVTSKRFSRHVIFVLLILSVLSFYFIAQTAMLGGQIRHTEISTAK